MKWITIPVACSLLLAACYTNRSAKAPAQPVATVGTDRPDSLGLSQQGFDFGNMEYGKATQAHSFWLYNRGGRRTEIRDITPTCGCMVADFDKTKRWLNPGDSIELKLRHNGNGAGRFNKDVIIVYGVQPKLYYITLSGNIDKPTGPPKALVDSLFNLHNPAKRQ
jgi:hypothetical protein